MSDVRLEVTDFLHAFAIMYDIAEGKTQKTRIKNARELAASQIDWAVAELIDGPKLDDAAYRAMKEGK